MRKLLGSFPLCSFALLLWVALPPLAQANADKTVGIVIGVNGIAVINRNGETLDATMSKGVEPDDWLRTGPDSSLKVLMNDKSIINLGPSVQLHLTAYRTSEEKTKTSLLRLVQGTIRVFVTKIFRIGGGRFYVRTPSAVAGVRGTYFIVNVDPGGARTVVDVINGRVALTPSQLALGPLNQENVDYPLLEKEFENGAVEITAGQSASVSSDFKPSAALDSNDESVKLRLEEATTPSSLQKLTGRDGGWVGGAVTGLSPANYDKKGAAESPSTGKAAPGFPSESFSMFLISKRSKFPAGASRNGRLLY
jgi:hypothetical protein